MCQQHLLPLTANCPASSCLSLPVASSLLPLVTLFLCSVIAELAEVDDVALLEEMCGRVTLPS